MPLQPPGQLAISFRTTGTHGATTNSVAPGGQVNCEVTLSATTTTCEVTLSSIPSTGAFSFGLGAFIASPGNNIITLTASSTFQGAEVLAAISGQDPVYRYLSVAVS